MSDQAEHGGSALTAGLLARAHAARRGLHEVLARLWASVWLIVAVTAIMVALIGFADLPPLYALAGTLGFIGLVVFLPRPDIEPPVVTTPHTATASQVTAAMQIMADALPDPAIVLNAAGQVLFFNAPARGLFASLRRNVYVDERTVDVHIGRLRKALIRGQEPDPVRTVRGAGYAFSDQPEDTA